MGLGFTEAMSTVRLMEDGRETAPPVAGKTRLDSLALSRCKSCLFDREISRISEDKTIALAWKQSQPENMSSWLKRVSQNHTLTHKHIHTEAF